ncbi:hypothetical protein [Sinosporangium siamense]|uniref:SPFH domain / Band 7 family protein n=1 Tax=Sinosporangium siamense TaxID=1367973 RepID=A0A919RLM8_9ACTN|nr:hypothetical protein [Sinosporangium siamense]GII95472.1 hypothetical protein Ssi02_57030 [Sinosporangium siamense]
MKINPIVDDQPLSRLRLRPIPSPGPGRALVLVRRQGAPLVVHSGEPIPDARYTRMVLVDMREHRVVHHYPLLSRDPNFAFQAQVSVDCHVVNPVEVVRRGIADLGHTVDTEIKHVLRRIARLYDIDDLNEAEGALNTIALNTGVQDIAGDVVAVRRIFVELLIDTDEAVTSGRAFREIERGRRLAGMRHDEHMSRLRAEGAEGLIAEIRQLEGPCSALEAVVAIDRAERAESAKALERVLEHSPGREPFDLIHAQRVLLDQVTGESAAPFGGTRSSRLRGSMAREIEVGTAGAGATSRDGQGDVGREGSTPASRGRPGLASRGGLLRQPRDAPPTAPVDGDRPRVSRVRGIPPDANGGAR